ncbi:uncharacterized protein V6R79_015393, partial [Siganus canaliculatus]
VTATAPEPPDLAGVPAVYHDLAQVFSKARATSLPPHRPYDCAIDLLPGTTPPKGRLYSLSEPERKAMEAYISSSLAAGIIRPSSSPAGAGFFFAFQLLKEKFTSAPILQVPDPNRQFVVEVDASDIGVGAVLSQRTQGDLKLHPCAFFSRRLSQAERNYDIGNRELLAVKLALEEWRHWLEGAKTPFVVWTDHKNLEYISTAKRLNSRQARWALFFTRFNF